MAAIELYSTPLFSDGNIVSYYRLESNSNDSVSSNNGTDTSMSYGSSYGKFSNGANFSGSARIAFSSTILGTGAKSISFWMKSSSASSLTTLFSNTTWDVNNPGISLFCAGSDGKMTFQIRGSGTNNSELNFTTGVYDGNRHHIVCTYTGDSTTNGQKVYLDGSLHAQKTNSNTDTAPYANMVVGSARNGSNLYNYTGHIDDLAFFNRVLTSDEVSNLYNGTWGSPSPSLSPSLSPSASQSPSASPSASESRSPSASASPSSSPSASESRSPSPSPSPSSSPSSSESRSPSLSPSPSSSPSASESRSPSQSGSPSPSLSPSASPSPSSSISLSPSLSPSVSVSLSPSVSESSSMSATPSASPSLSESASPSATPSSSPSASQSPSSSESSSTSPSPSLSPSLSPSSSISPSPSPAIYVDKYSDTGNTYADKYTDTGNLWIDKYKNWY